MKDRLHQTDQRHAQWVADRDTRTVEDMVAYTMVRCLIALAATAFEILWMVGEKVTFR